MNTFLKEGVVYNFVSITDNEECRTWLLKHFDIGTWIGLTSIWLEKHFKHIVCVETDNLSLSALEANMNASMCTNYSIVPNAIYNTNTTL